MYTSPLAYTLLRTGVAFAFLYPPLSAFFNPYAWIGYFPQFVLSYSPLEAIYVLHLFGLLEICIGLWILFGKKLTLPLYFGGALLSLIVIFNLNQMDVLFRDVPIICMVLSLLLMSKKDKRILG